MFKGNTVNFPTLYFVQLVYFLYSSVSYESRLHILNFICSYVVYNCERKINDSEVVYTL